MSWVDMVSCLARMNGEGVESLVACVSSDSRGCSLGVSFSNGFVDVALDGAAGGWAERTTEEG